MTDLMVDTGPATGPGSPRWNMTNHPMSEDNIGWVEGLREWFIKTADEVEFHCPPSRERSLALTNLEQALMWAVASIARQPA